MGNGAPRPCLQLDIPILVGCHSTCLITNLLIKKYNNKKITQSSKFSFLFWQFLWYRQKNNGFGTVGFFTNEIFVKKNFYLLQFNF